MWKEIWWYECFLNVFIHPFVRKKGYIVELWNKGVFEIKEVWTHWKAFWLRKTLTLSSDYLALIPAGSWRLAKWLGCPSWTHAHDVVSVWPHHGRLHTSGQVWRARDPLQVQEFHSSVLVAHHQEGCKNRRLRLLSLLFLPTSVGISLTCSLSVALFPAVLLYVCLSQCNVAPLYYKCCVQCDPVIITQLLWLVRLRYIKTSV